MTEEIPYWEARQDQVNDRWFPSMVLVKPPIRCKFTMTFETKEECDKFIDNVLMKAEHRKELNGWVVEYIGMLTGYMPVYYKDGEKIYQVEALSCPNQATCQFYITKYLNNLVPNVLLEDNDG